NIGNTGEFLFYAPWHDQAAKTILGINLPANNGIEDGRSLFDIVCSHPGAATYVATKLARRLLGDVPPPSVVDTAAQVFREHVSSPDQIARTIRSIVLAPEFLETWGEKVKRPL